VGVKTSIAPGRLMGLPYTAKMVLSERDVGTKFITPVMEKAGWDVQTQVRDERAFE
jgi:type I site-specific restriction endonuclease